MKRFIALLLMCGLGSVCNAGWTVIVGGDPMAMANDGYLVKASNLGSGAAVQTINGIAYDVDYSNISEASATSSSWASKFYSGSDPAVSNLLNTGGKVSEWNPKNMVFTFSGLTVGQNYRFQLLLGGDWAGCDANLYGNGWSDHKYVYFGNSVVRLLTYTWTADADNRAIRTNAASGFGNYYNLAYALHNTSIPEPATLVLLGIGGLVSLRRKARLNAV